MKKKTNGCIHVAYLLFSFFFHQPKYLGFSLCICYVYQITKIVELFSFLFCTVKYSPCTSYKEILKHSHKTVVCCISELQRYPHPTRKHETCPYIECVCKYDCKIIAKTCSTAQFMPIDIFGIHTLYKDIVVVFVSIHKKFRCCCCSQNYLQKKQRMCKKNYLKKTRTTEEHT